MCHFHKTRPIVTKNGSYLDSDSRFTAQIINSYNKNIICIFYNKIYRLYGSYGPRESMGWPANFYKNRIGHGLCGLTCRTQITKTKLGTCMSRGLTSESAGSVAS